MRTTIPRIAFPELFFGFVAPIGTDFPKVVKGFQEKLEQLGYRAVQVKVTDVFNIAKEYLKPNIPLVTKPLYERYETHIKYGNQLRTHFDNDAVLAMTAIKHIVRARIRLSQTTPPLEKVAYLIHQFKRKEEIDLLRSVYGELFIQVSVYSRRGSRVDFLSREFAKSAGSSGPTKYRHRAEKVVEDDENEVDDKHGQRVTKVFHDADVIINIDSSDTSEYQIDRFCELLFGSNKISPSRIEYGMFMAKAAALRTLDLSRQVGSAIFSADGEILALGSNEVPKANGGTYWGDEPFDDREYVRQIDSNDQRKREILSQIIEIVSPDADVEEVLSRQDVRDSQFMDALEYGRIVHAEMSAISDAARLGRAIKGSVLYCTTFPCHMCAKHIVASGVSKVIFLEPYPKSLAADLHSDSIQVEGGDRGRYKDYPSVSFEHFYGVSPRRYRELFERGGRKNKTSSIFEGYKFETPAPIIDTKHPSYIDIENRIIDELVEPLSLMADGDET